MFALIFSLFSLLSLVAIACVTCYAVLSYTIELNAYHYEAFNFGAAAGYSVLGMFVFYGVLIACYQLARMELDNMREALADIRFARELYQRHAAKFGSVREKYGLFTALLCKLTGKDVFRRNVATVRETYGKSACTCDSATCKGAHWKNWTCPSPDMDVQTWERMKLAHVRPVSARRVRRSPRVHSIARVSIIAVSGVPVA